MIGRICNYIFEYMLFFYNKFPYTCYQFYRRGIIVSSEKPLKTADFKGPVQDFTDFCTSERERRINSGAAFDSKEFDRAVNLATKKLQALEGGEF